MGLLAERTSQKINRLEDIGKKKKQTSKQIGNTTEQNKQRIVELWDKFKQPYMCH